MQQWGAAAIVLSRNPRMADGKWIDNLTANTPLAVAAQQVLLARLQVVSNYLPKALYAAQEDQEFVHQLRVACRRAEGALRIFAPCLPTKTSRQARKRLQRLRRASGAARDLDVLATRLLERQEHQPAKEQPGVDYLVGHALGQRAQAQEALIETGRRDGHDFEVFLRDVILGVHAPTEAAPDVTLVVLARPLLSTLMHNLEEKAHGDLTEYPHLHEVRIAGKRLRYAMEVFAPCFGPAFRQTIYAEVEDMQEILGRANDRYVAAERIKEIRTYLRVAWPDAWKRLGPGIEGNLRFHQRQLPVERRRFVRLWKHWQDSLARQLRECLHTDATVWGRAH
jgi:CHAD domain-containing protein